ncbi:MAG: hypothetical protein WCO16_01125 [bacterium]
MHFEVEPIEQEQMEPLAHSEDIKPPVISLEDLELMCDGEPVLEELLGTMLKSCIAYTITVANWKRKYIETRGEITDEFEQLDGVRRSIHDNTIADINIFSRNLAKFQKDNSWMSTAGMDGKNRAAYTRFAVSLSLSRI